MTNPLPTQPLNLTAFGAPGTTGVTSDSNGNFQGTFGTPPNGLCWTGSVQVPGAPSGATFSIYAGGVLIGTWAGTLPVGPVQSRQGGPLTITGTGYTPNTVYMPLFVGSSSDNGSTAPEFPLALSSIVEVTNIEDVALSLSLGGGLSTVDSGAVPNGSYELLPAPPSGRCWKIWSITFLGYASDIPSGDAVSCTQGSGAGVEIIAAMANLGGTVVLGGRYVNSAVWFQNTSPVTCVCSIAYDETPIPTIT